MQPGAVNGFGQHVVAADLAVTLDVGTHHIGGQRDDGPAVAGCPQHGDRTDAIHHGHLDVHQHQIEVTGHGLLDRQLAVADDLEFSPGALQVGRNQALVVHPIFGHQDAAGQGRYGQCVVLRRLHGQSQVCRCANPGGRQCRPVCGPRQAQSEAAAAAELRFHLHFATHQVRQLLADEQPQPGAAEAARGGHVGLREGLEQAADLLGAQADAGVDDGQLQHVARQRARPQRDRAAGSELDRIAAKIQQHLLQSHVVRAHHGGQWQFSLDHKLKALFAGPRAQQLLGVVEQSGQPDFSQFQFQTLGFNLGHVQDVADDLQQVVPVAHDGAQGFVLADARAIVQEQFGKADDGRQRRSNLVAHVGQERALGVVGRHRFVAGGHGFGGARGNHIVELDDQCLQFDIGVVQLPGLVLQQLFGLFARSAFARQAALQQLNLLLHGGLGGCRNGWSRHPVSAG